MTRGSAGEGRWRGGAAIVLFWLLTAMLAGRGDADADRVTITFNDVVVEGFVGIFDTPEVAHLDPIDVAASPADGPAPEAKPSGGPTDTEGVSRAPGERPSPRAARRAANAGVADLPGSSLGRVPGLGTANPSFTESGFRVEAFWAMNIGRPEGHFRRAHFHPPKLSTGFEALHLGNRNELHGIHIGSLDGQLFALNSLRYRVTRNRQLPWKPFSVEGFSNYNVQILVARSFDPRRSVRSQFTPYPVGLPVGNDMGLPWWTLQISGFEATDQVYLASSASVDIDDVVLRKLGRVP